VTATTPSAGLSPMPEPIAHSDGWCHDIPNGTFDGIYLGGTVTIQTSVGRYAFPVLEEVYITDPIVVTAVVENGEVLVYKRIVNA
jgi:hypothetical protein